MSDQQGPPAELYCGPYLISTPQPDVSCEEKARQNRVPWAVFTLPHPFVLDSNLTARPAEELARGRAVPLPTVGDNPDGLSTATAAKGAI